MADKTISSSSGAAIGLSGFGDPMAERIVVVCHPSPGAATFDPEPVLTGRWGVHIIALERPGYGSSDLLPDGAVHSIADRADDIAEFLVGAERIADRISQAELRRFGVIGWGTGGLVAAALAARHPDQVDRLALVGVPAARSAAKLARRAFVAPPSLAALHVSEGDPDLARHVGLRNRLERMIGDAFTQGRAGVDADRLAMADDSWVPSLSGITAESTFWLGDRDPIVDEDDVRWWARHIPGLRARHVLDSGPLAIAAAWQRILEFVAPDRGGLADVRDARNARVANVDPVHPEAGASV